jgi:hypothetical protein
VTAVASVAIVMAAASVATVARVVRAKMPIPRRKRSRNDG